ncbi:MAG: hypothetical protein ACRCZF_19810 [Gemmataceae bacterium]
MAVPKAEGSGTGASGGVLFDFGRGALQSKPHMVHAQEAIGNELEMICEGRKMKPHHANRGAALFLDDQQNELLGNLNAKIEIGRHNLCRILF